MQGPCCFGPAQASDIMILDTLRGDFVEISLSSYGLSLFSSKAGSHHDEGAGAVHEESPSVSIGELWPGIDQLDETGPEGTSVIVTPNPWRSLGSGRIGEGTSRASEGALVVGVSGLSAAAPPRGCGRDSTRDRAKRILADAPGAISPHMRRSFVDRQYSPLTGMTRSEWEIILEELTCM
jgi:hypothetical protein